MQPAEEEEKVEMAARTCQSTAAEMTHVTQSVLTGGQRGRRMRTTLLSIALWERGRVKITTAYSTALTSCRFSQSLARTEAICLAFFIFYDLHSKASLFLFLFSSAFFERWVWEIKANYCFGGRMPFITPIMSIICQSQETALQS